MNHAKVIGIPADWSSYYFFTSLCTNKNQPLQQFRTEQNSIK